MTARSASVALTVALVLCAGAPLAIAQAQDKAPERKALRVCQDPNNLPFSNTKGEGIENRIAEVLRQGAGPSRHLLLVPEPAGLHPQHAALQAARRPTTPATSS